jgi:GTP-binding protein
MNSAGVRAEIRDVVFRGAGLAASERPGEWYPHVAVAGRSNVGKSSLLNWLFRRQVAHVAKAPGKTRTINFYLVNDAFYMVDLPGYGYAKVARELRAQWGRELERYLSEDDRIAGVISLIDIRHGPTELDDELQNLLDAIGRRRVVVLTKTDKVGRGQRARMRQEVQRRLGLATPPLALSVRTGEGRGQLMQHIDDLVTSWRQSQTGE